MQTSDGAVRDADLIIAAVGFQTEKFLWPTEYVGADGVSLEDVWKVQGAQAHLGMTVPGFPNLFMLYGPNSQPVASGAGLPIWLETWCGYIAGGSWRCSTTGTRRWTSGGRRSTTTTSSCTRKPVG